MPECASDRIKFRQKENDGTLEKEEGLRELGELLQRWREVKGEMANYGTGEDGSTQEDVLVSLSKI